MTSKEMVRGTAEHGYSCLPNFSYMFDTLNVGPSYSIMVSKDTHRLVYYFLAFGACIRGFSHMITVMAIDDTHLHGKYEGVLLSVVAQDTQNHVYPIAFMSCTKRMMHLGRFYF